MKLSEDPRFSKLPKWVRDEVATLEREHATARRAAVEARLLTKPDQTDTVLHATYQDDFVGLPHGAQVRFALDGNPDDWNGQYIDARVTDGQLQLRGGRGISITPWASNVVHVKAAER